MSTEFDPEAFLARYAEQDAKLAALPDGYPTSPWWFEQVARIVYDAGSKRRFIGRVGRRGGKSSTMTRLAVCWALHGPSRIAPGDVGVIPIISVSRPEAQERLRLIRVILETVGEPFDEAGETIALKNKPIEFRVHTCAIRGVVGFTSIAIVCDEMAHWESRDSYANPAKSVVGNLMPTMATQPYGWAAMISTPWAFDDLHSELFDAGDTDAQNVAHAATWVSNPELTEAATRVDEPDEREHLRQYGAEPSQNVSAAFDIDEVKAAVGRPCQTKVNFVAIDLSKAKRDHRAVAVGNLTHEELIVHEVTEYPNEMDLEDVISAVADLAKQHKVDSVWSDAYMSPELHFRRHGLKTVDIQPTNALNEAAAETFRTMLRDGKVSLPDNPDLIKQIGLVREKLLPNQKRKYTTNGLDLVSAAIFTPLIVLAKDPDAVQPGRDPKLYTKARDQLFSLLDGQDADRRRWGPNYSPFSPPWGMR